jgi:hypothetical protein
MTTSLAFCANSVSLIDLPRTKPIDDPQASRQATVQWHFGPDTLLNDPVNEPTLTNGRGGMRNNSVVRD